MNVEEVPLDRLHEHPANPRQGDVGSIVESIKAHGWFGTIVAQSDGTVLAGNHRLKAARELALPSVPVFWVDVDDETALRILLADNRTSDLASWDDSALVALLTDLQQQSERGLVGLGWDGSDLDALIAEVAKSNGHGLVDPGPSEPPVEPITKPGDLIVLGEHRLLCGDATKPEDYDRVLDGGKAGLCLTDPPYGNATPYTSYEDTPENLLRLIAKAMPLILANAGVALVTPGVGNMYRYPPPKWVLCWPISAGSGSGPWGFASWQPILAYGPDPYLARGLGRRPDTIATASLPHSSTEHPVAKPIMVWKWLMERGSAEPGEIVLDPFCGSGTSIIAGESIHRRVRALELDPGYCDVICNRWAAMTGREPERLQQ